MGAVSLTAPICSEVHFIEKDIPFFYCCDFSVFDICLPYFLQGRAKAF